MSSFFMTILPSLPRHVPGRLFLVLVLAATFAAPLSAQFKFREPPNRGDPGALHQEEGMSLWHQFIANRALGSFSIEGELIYRPARAASSSLRIRIEADWQPALERTRVVLQAPFMPPVERTLLVGVDGVFDLVESQDSADVLPVSEDALMQPLLPGLPITWNDLLLAYLQWDDVSYAGPTRMLGRPAHRFVLRNPNQQAEPASVSVSIDEDFAALLQADLRNARDDVIKRIRIGSFRQFGDLWMFSELFWEDRSTRDSVVLRVDAFSAGHLAD